MGILKTVRETYLVEHIAASYYSIGIKLTVDESIGPKYNTIF